MAVALLACGLRSQLEASLCTPSAAHVGANADIEVRRLPKPRTGTEPGNLMRTGPPPPSSLRGLTVGIGHTRPALPHRLPARLTGQTRLPPDLPGARYPQARP
jgi:hypothetical protein